MNFPRMNYATENENEKKKNHHEFSHLWFGSKNKDSRFRLDNDQKKPQN